MDKPKPPPPPPRPDLEDSIGGFDEACPPVDIPAHPPVGSKRGPPPIPSRPDLGEDDTPTPLCEVPQKKVPPAVAVKNKSGSIKSRGRPEITIVSAQPMGSVVPPPTLPPQTKLPPPPQPATQPPTVVLPPSLPIQAQHPPVPPPTTHPPPEDLPMDQSVTPPYQPQLAPPPVHPRVIEATQDLNEVTASKAPHSHLKAVGPTTQPIGALVEQATSPDAVPVTKPEGDLPQRPARKSKGRAPPQRPKSKPVCDLPMLGEINTGSGDLLQPIRPSEVQKEIVREELPEGMEEMQTGSGVMEGDVKQQPLIVSEVHRPDETVITSNTSNTLAVVNLVGQNQVEQMDAELSADNRANELKHEKPKIQGKPPPPAKKPKPAVSAKPQVAKKLDHHANTSEPVGGAVDAPPTKSKPKPKLINPPKRKVVGSSTFYFDEQENQSPEKNSILSDVKPSEELSEIKFNDNKTGENTAASDLGDLMKQNVIPNKRRTKPTVIKSKKMPAASKEKSQIDSSFAELNAHSNDAFDDSKQAEEVAKEESKVTKPKKEPMIIRPKKKCKKEKGKDLGEGVRFEKASESVSSNKGSSELGDNNRGSPEGESKEQSVSTVAPKKKAPPRPGPPRAGPARPAPPRPSAGAAKDKTETTRPKDDQLTSGGRGRARPKPPRPTDQHVKTHETVTEGEESHKPPRPATIGKEKDDTEIREHKELSSPPHKGKRSRPNAPVPKATKADREPTVISSVEKTTIEPSAIALFDYETENEEDLVFKAGDEIVLVERVGKDWYVGRCGDRQGMMPASYVEVIEDLPPEPTKPSTDVVALYNFTGESDDELTILAGDTIQLLEIVNDDWLRGILFGKVGMFPASFVEVSPELRSLLMDNKTTNKGTDNTHKPDDELRRESSISSGPRCQALFDYPGDAADDLSFVQDDVIRLIERISTEWLKGELRGKSGMFPAAYVEIIEDLHHTKMETSIPNPAPTTKLPVSTALFDYSSEVSGDLSFRQGDRITVLGQASNDWLEGEVDGRRGIFPEAFVEPIDAPEESARKQIDADPVNINKKQTSQLQEDLLPKAKALYDFQGEEDDELTFKAGDTIILLSRVNAEWMDGELDGKIGRFPSAFVETLVPLP